MHQSDSIKMKFVLMKHYLKFGLAACIWVFGLAQCGVGDSLSSQISVTMTPESPVVINSKMVLNPGDENERTIQPPWFLWGTLVRNSSQSTLVLATFNFKVQGNNNGSTTKSSHTLDPNVTCDATGFNRSVLAIIPPRRAFSDLTASGTDKCDPSDILTSSLEQWFIDSLAATSDFVYSVEVTGIGWFTDSNGVPTERFESNDFLITQ
jgi:hypothetical protein